MIRCFEDRPNDPSLHTSFSTASHDPMPMPMLTTPGHALSRDGADDSYGIEIRLGLWTNLEVFPASKVKLTHRRLRRPGLVGRLGDLKGLIGCRLNVGGISIGSWGDLLVLYRTVLYSMYYYSTSSYAYLYGWRYLDGLCVCLVLIQ